MIHSGLDAARLDADVCIVGSGAAGLTLARELSGGALRVCVLESGGRRPAVQPDPHYALRATELPIASDSRVRALGGTTTAWVGRWKRFDPIDLAARPWVAGPGWPLPYHELEPYYRRAAALVELDERPRPDDAPGFLPAGSVVSTVFRTVELARRDFGRVLGGALHAAPNIEIVLDAHAIALERTGSRVTRVRARTPRGELEVIANRVVLAAGGIENARLLLLSELDPHDQVGRCYMDHPKAVIGVVETYRPLDLSSWRGLSEDAPVYAGYRLADAEQRDRAVLNCYAFLAPLFERDLPSRLVRRVRRPRRARVLVVRNYLEQEPRPDNRVTLDRDHRDPYGQPIASVRWTISDLERHSLTELHRALARELQRARIGELHSELLDGRTPPALGDASHHMGTTRMGRDPRTSVVDSDGRVHELDNLFVAGSSVFPTSGYANPTATIVALAIRLADHLKEAG
ncbi:MAG: GMC family oxidoreductase [Deltaproteobacteria bacterium]|nr:GMC family oxidoreductase [Deltaproteobacteria bacterium]